MIKHLSHQMQNTSLYNYFPRWDEGEFNAAFRQPIKARIMSYACKVDDFTDRELIQYLGYADTNKVRPRRNELTKKGFLIELRQRPCQVTGKLCIAWAKNMEKLNAYMG